jgi:hypothetical protein
MPNLSSSLFTNTCSYPTGTSTVVFFSIHLFSITTSSTADVFSVENPSFITDNLICAESEVEFNATSSVFILFYSFICYFFHRIAKPTVFADKEFCLTKLAGRTISILFFGVSAGTIIGSAFLIVYLV